MKITSPVNEQGQTAHVNKAAIKRKTDRDMTSKVGALTGAKRDFANVLQEVSHRRGKRHDRDEKERSETKPIESVTPEAEGQRREDMAETGAGGSRFTLHQSVREVDSGSDVLSPRTILQLADLERIVAAVHTNLAAGGQREVTLELSRSVLEGLRIKLSADKAGRITAEFITTSEKVRALLDVRSSELSNLLRSRDVDLVDLKTTVHADASGHNRSPGNQKDSTPDALTKLEKVSVSSSAVPAETIAEDMNNLTIPTTTYRA